MIETGIIIAAGAGSRLADEKEIPKPLRRVAGLLLIERIILSAARGGLKKIIVVVGNQKDRIESFLKSRSWPLQIQTVENADWKKSNGVSVLAAQPLVHEPFFLFMSDHVFDYRLLQRMQTEGLGNLDLKLAVDKDIKSIFDLDDATKVLTQNGLIAEIGKVLPHYDAIDTGIFMASTKLFDALAEEQTARGDCSLSHGVSRLAAAGKAGVTDSQGAFWQDVDTAPSLKHAEKVLLNACRKTTDGVISRNFNRYISLAISRVLMNTPITANMMTFVTTIIGLASGWYAMQGTYASYALAGILFKMTSILDGVDGELSKLRLTDSKLGQWLDTAGDNLTYVVFIVGTAIGVAHRTDLNAATFLPYTAVAGMVLQMSVMFGMLLLFTKSGSLLAVEGDFLKEKKTNPIGKLIQKFYYVGKRDFFATAFALLALIDKPHWILALITIATPITSITLIQSRLKARKMSTV